MVGRRKGKRHGYKQDPAGGTGGEEEAEADRDGTPRHRDRARRGQDALRNRAGARQAAEDRHARDQGPGGRVRQRRGRARQQPLRPPLRMHEARRLQGVLPAQEHAMQVLPPVQLALPRLHRGQVREAGVVPVRLQRVQGTGARSASASTATAPRRRTTARSSSSRAGAPTSRRRSCSSSTSCSAA